MGWANVNNQVCLAHLIRDVQYAIDAGDDIFAPELAICWVAPAGSGDAEKGLPTRP